MMYFSSFFNFVEQSRSSWFDQLSLTGGVPHKRSRRNAAEPDAHMLRDIGLEPFDVYFGWRGAKLRKR